MAIITVDPSTLGAFDPEDVVLEHGDNVLQPFWNTYAENGAKAYCIWKPVLSFSGSVVTSEATFYGCLPPVNPSVYWTGAELTESATFRFYAEGAGSGRITVYGGTTTGTGMLPLIDRLAFTGSVYGSYAGTFAVPGYYLDAGVTKAIPYFLRVEITGVTSVSQVHVFYTKYPNY